MLKVKGKIEVVCNETMNRQQENFLQGLFACSTDRKFLSTYANVFITNLNYKLSDVINCHSNLYNFWSIRI